MANLKIRGIRDSIDAQGPQNGPAQPMDIGATSIVNQPEMSCPTPRRESGPQHLPNSSLGAKQLSHKIYGRKA